MDKFKRKQLLLERIEKEGVIKTKFILIFANENGINSTTARRDLQELEKENKISVSFGLIRSFENYGYGLTRDQSKQKEKSKKEIIASEAIKNLKDGEILFFGPGTTIENFVKKINKNIKMAVTNSFPVFLEAWKNPNIKEILLIGGIFKSNSQIFWNKDAKKYLEGIKFSTTYFSCLSIDFDGNVYDDFLPEANVLKEALSRSSKKILLVDSTKFLDSGIYNFINAIEIDKIITDFEAQDFKLNFETNEKILYSKENI